MDMSVAGTVPGAVTPLDVLRTTSLIQAVEKEVERMIVAGELTGGSHVSEQALAARLGVSRGPVREAFRSLVQAGLLVAVRNRGVFVREIALSEVLELYDVRATLEGDMAASLHGQVEAGLLKTLRDVVRRMRDAAHRTDVAETYMLNVLFHELLADACRNVRLVAIYRAVVRDMHLFRREGLDLLFNGLLSLILTWFMADGIETLVLANAPGGVAETSLTAKALHLGVATVTAFHLVRILFIVLLSAPLYRLLRRLGLLSPAASGFA